ncbi:M3 family oligoendopeptidase [Geomonas subterranea]|uniref:M3 family oligoendopeptidase n=1 Tax=Geomonas subterranea TaxID=2847989 RepID=A0ABX8LGH5_9BACT|nr:MULTISPECIES: M3 family oligoendopeptidase [Geomonas]QXE91130.1 M3 family oligoendopeptidase [Geomonas subterranea]QXM10783.1 M3 family oligoendopeptidase [Geomonas subterranea]
MSSDLNWDTTPLYPSPSAPELTKAFDDATVQVAGFRERYRGKVAGLSAAALLEALQAYEKLQEELAVPQLYSHLLFAADSESDLHKRLSQKSQEFGNAMGRELLFFDLEIIQMEEEPYQQLLQDPVLGNYRHFLAVLRKFKKHTLSEREESLLTQKSLTGVQAFCRLFDEVSASLRYTLEMDGETKEMTGEELLALLHHPDAALRERAFGTFLKKHEEHSILYSAVFNNVALDHSQEMELRNYSHPMEPTNLGNEIPNEVVESLMQVSEKNYPLAQEYFRLKARLLGIPKLKNTDVYAPLTESDRTYSFEEARAMTVEAYRGFSEEFAQLADSFFTGKRVDVLPRPGKSGGAFCMGMTPSLPPYLLLNFTGNLRDVATIAHEVGHGIHYQLAQRQTMLNYHPPLPLAETASVFGEMLLTRQLLERETDVEVKKSLLCAKIEDIIATTFRQNVLTRFEEQMHLERVNGLLTATELSDLWWRENAKLYGDSVEMIEPYRYGWSYISHFIHARFYCYSYTCAELVVLSLFQRYLKERESFVPIYREILADGGSKSPGDTLAPAGIVFSDPSFWQGGYDLLADLIAELKALL